MEELRIPTRRIAVELFLADGVHTRGVLFLTEGRYHDHGPEMVADLLNDERVFVPFKADDPLADDRIISKNYLTRVRLQEALPPPPDPDLPECTIILCDRSRLTGQLRFDAPQSASRLVDKFNNAPPFLMFVSDEGLDFVHRKHITQVLQYDQR